MFDVVAEPASILPAFLGTIGLMQSARVGPIRA